MHGVVKPEVGEMEQFLGRNPERKPKIRILANDMGKKSSDLYTFYFTLAVCLLFTKFVSILKVGKIW